MDQVHSDDLVIAQELPVDEIPRADALISCDAEIVLCVRTADCVPVLAWSEDAPMIAAVHAGWRGLAKGIVEKSIRRMQELGARDIKAAMGPAVGPCCYKVGRDVINELKGEPRIDDAGSLFADLWNEAVLQLVQAGLFRSEITLYRICTSCNEKRFFSYRRQAAQAGRNISVIGGSSWLLPGLQAG